MAQYRTDLKDINFNLFELFQCQSYIEGYEVNDLKEIVNQFDKFIENEVFPTREEGDTVGVKLTDAGVVVPPSFKKAHDGYYGNGWMGLGYPEDIGGIPAPKQIYVACNSICNSANVSYAMYPNLTQGALNTIRAAGSPEQVDKYSVPMIEGRWGGTMCLTEAGAGSDVGALTTTATPLDNGKYSIKGVKIFISSGESDLYENNIHLVLARTPEGVEGTKGISLFIVPRYKINDDGTSGESNDVKCTKIEEKMGLHGQATCELTFGQNGQCEGELIGKEFEGMANMFIMMNEARLLCGVQGESQANMAFELSEQYARERSQFKSEIINLPDVKRMLLKMRSMSRGMRTLNLYIASLFDQEESGNHEVNDLIALLTPISKSFCTDEGFQVCVDAIQVHGGYGYCSEYGVEQYARDSKIASIYEGTNGIQAIDFVTRKILKDQGKAITKLATMIQKDLESPHAAKFKSEVGFIAKSLAKAQEILGAYTKKASEKNFNGILATATDFLNYCGNLTIAWLSFKSACKALDLIDGANGDDKKYYQSKIDDFKIFCQHYLVRNSGIAQSILNFEEDLTSMEV